jgi:hypothetical protein
MDTIPLSQFGVRGVTFLSPVISAYGLSSAMARWHGTGCNPTPLCEAHGELQDFGDRYPVLFTKLFASQKYYSII